MCQPVKDYIESLKDSGSRGLLVVNSHDPRRASSMLAETVGNDCLLVAEKGLRGAGCRYEKSPMDIEEYLGLEVGAAIVASTGLLRPGLIASAGETVRAGGFLALAGPPWSVWNPGPSSGTGEYKRYLEEIIPQAETHMWIDLDKCNIITRRPPPKLNPVKWKPGKAPPGAHGAIYRLARTPDQARGIELGARLVRGRARSLYIVGDRGRGKSFLTGLIVAQAVAFHSIGTAQVVAPTLLQAQQVFKGLIEGLRASGVLKRPGVKVKADGNGRVVRVTGPWFRVSYEAPHAAGGAALVVVDEAAAVGVHRVRRITWSSGRSIVSTTIHGYEGSGRVFAHMVDRILPRPRLEVELSHPVRYLPGDPLERWLYKYFLLDIEPIGPRSVDPSQLNVEWPSRGELRSPDLLRWIMAVLVLAHYRNTPDDLLAVLESPHHHVAVLNSPEGPVAASLLVVEEWEGDPQARLALERLALYASRARGLRSVRISRIAVLPWLQRRGLGSTLLRHIERWASDEGFNMVTTIFSRHDVIRFWSKNGYLYTYMSPRQNRVTGEKNLVAAKGLDKEGRRTVSEASGVFRVRLLLASHTIYRDVEAEKIAEILRATSKPGETPTLAPTKEMLDRLQRCAQGVLEAEQAWEAIYLAVANRFAKEDLPSGAEGVYIVSRILQGKPDGEALKVSGLDGRRARSLLRKLCGRAVTLT